MTLRIIRGDPTAVCDSDVGRSQDFNEILAKSVERLSQGLHFKTIRKSSCKLTDAVEASGDCANQAYLAGSGNAQSIISELNSILCSVRELNELLTELYGLCSNSNVSQNDYDSLLSEIRSINKRKVANFSDLARSEPHYRLIWDADAMGLGGISVENGKERQLAHSRISESISLLAYAKQRIEYRISVNRYAVLQLLVARENKSADNGSVSAKYSGRFRPYSPGSGNKSATGALDVLKRIGGAYE